MFPLSGRPWPATMQLCTVASGRASHTTRLDRRREQPSTTKNTDGVQRMQEFSGGATGSASDTSSGVLCLFFFDIILARSSASLLSFALQIHIPKSR